MFGDDAWICLRWLLLILVILAVVGVVSIFIWVFS